MHRAQRAVALQRIRSLLQQPHEAVAPSLATRNVGAAVNRRSAGVIHRVEHLRQEKLRARPALNDGPERCTGPGCTRVRAL